MYNITVLEEFYNRFSKNLQQWLPEGLIPVDINLLHRFNLLHYYNKEKHDPSLTRYFNVIESVDKITLVNEQFIVWIVPGKLESDPITYTLIALNRQDNPHLELAFTTTGVYNTSKLVLRILEKFLFEIQENEDLLTRIKKVS
jgi:hypothetical protein